MPREGFRQDLYKFPHGPLPGIKKIDEGYKVKGTKEGAGNFYGSSAAMLNSSLNCQHNPKPTQINRGNRMNEVKHDHQLLGLKQVASSDYHRGCTLYWILKRNV